MNHMPIDDYYRNVALYRRLAERERVRATRAIAARAVAALLRLGRRLAPRFDLHPLRWTERLG